MRPLVVLFILLASCASPSMTVLPLPAQPYYLALIVQGQETEFCYDLTATIDLSTPQTFAASFVSGCDVSQTVTTSIVSESSLLAVCPQALLSCGFVDRTDDGATGSCTNDLGILTCDYDAWLDPVFPPS